MSSILGTVASFLGSEMAVKFIPEPVKILLSCLCFFDDNIQTLKEVARKLEDERASLQMSVDREVNNAQVVDPQVKTWLENVKEIQDKETEISIEQHVGLSAMSRFSITKKVKETTEAMEELLQSHKFNTISHPPLPAALVSIPLGPTFEFESRKDIEEGIMTSLRGNEANKVGICGMGGVGKTTMAKRIMHRVREEHLFKEIVMVVVSYNADMLRIQDDIAKSLGLKLGDGSLSSRAHLLRTRLSSGMKRCLIVLDDVWDSIKLEELGIFCDSGCKILLTSRNSDVLKRMHVENVHLVRVLSETEAWHLFKSNVGGCIDHQNIVPVARQVVRECNGLPIALVTVGVALKHMENTCVWEDSLQQLRSSNPKDMPEVLDGVYKPLRLSYELLKSEGAQFLFLLCCLYHEDDDIPNDELTFIAVGLGMCEENTSLEQVRNRVCSLVERLKSRFLLLEGSTKNHVKMHDVVRDVAIFIASDEKRITCDPKRNDCTWISPNIGVRIGLHLGFPNLHLLWIDRCSRDEELEIDQDFFQGMKELNVFSIKCPSLQQLPQTTRSLENLQTLVLVSCGSLGSLSVVGELVNLKILICRRCESLERLPVEMGRLSHLRLLEISDCKNMKTIAPGIISKQKGLEELIVEDCFNGWEAKVMEKEGKNASLSELGHLSNLTRLKIEIKDTRLAAEQLRLSPNMVGYDIKIGDDQNNRDLRERFEKKMKLVLPGNYISLGNWIHERVRSVEHMYLEGDGSSLDFGLAQNVRVLVIRKCSTVKKLVSTKNTCTVFPLLEVLRLEEVGELEKICDIGGPNNVSVFNNLSSIYVCECNRLQTLFSVSMMTRCSSLVQLERLEIYSCDMMEHVLLWDQHENQKSNPTTLIVFPKLRFLGLRFLPRLTSFSKGIERIEFPALQEMQVVHCPLKTFVFTSSSTASPRDDHDDDGDDVSIHVFCRPHKVKFDCLSKLELHQNVKMGRNWCPEIPLDFFARLRELKVLGFKSVKSLFSLSTSESGCLSQLEKLEIWYCDMMEQVVLWSEEENPRNIDIIAFPKLKFLRLDSLPRLTSFSKGIESSRHDQFLLPAAMKIWNCPLLETCGSTTSSADDDGSIHLLCKTDKVEFSSLEELHIGEYGGMRRNWCPMIAIFAGLSKLIVYQIRGVESLFSSSVAGNLLNMKYLYIGSCEVMVRVIEDVACGGETHPIPRLFPNLDRLHLDRLYKLNSFCEWRCALEFPFLRSLHISHCELMEGFTSGPLNTPILENVYIQGSRILINEDVNATLAQRREERRKLLEGSSVEQRRKIEQW